MMKKSKLLFILYPIGILFLYPIIRYIYFFTIKTSYDVKDRFVFIRVYLSSPLLIIVGICLFFLYKGFHKISGLIFISIGLLWFLFLIRELMHES